MLTPPARPQPPTTGPALSRLAFAGAVVGRVVLARSRPGAAGAMTDPIRLAVIAGVLLLGRLGWGIGGYLVPGSA